MKIAKIIFVSILLLASLDTLASEVICGHSYSTIPSMDEAIRNLNSILATKSNVLITTPVLYKEGEHSSTHIACVSVNDK